MRRVLTATLLTTAMAASAFCQAQAANSSSSSNSGGGASRVASFLVGTVVGMPISIVRTQKRLVVDFTNALTGNSKNPWAIAAVQPLTFIPAFANGMMEGILDAPLNAWRYSDQPFSPETFSLGDPDKK